MGDARRSFDVASLDAVAPVPFADVQWLPLRSTLGIEAFGVNAYTAGAAGERVIEEHTEAGNGHEELYVVVAGRARFTVDGQDVDAPAGTCVAIHDPAIRRTAVATESGTVVLAVGAPRGGVYAPSAWERAALALRAIQEGRLEDGLAVLRTILEETPESAWRRYDYACGLALAGRPDDAIEELRRVIDAEPQAAVAARADPDLASLTGRADWRGLVGP